MQKPVLVVMAAGMGSRYGGLKQIDPIGPNGELIIDFSIFDAIRAGFEKAVFVIKRENEALFREVIGSRFSHRIEVEYAAQELGDLPEGFPLPDGRVKPWGTGHAVLAARRAVNGAPFAAINADDFYGAEAFRLICRHLASVTDEKPYDFAMVGYRLANTLTDSGYVARGVCRTDGNGFLTGITERTRIEKRADGPAYTEDGGETWQPLDEDTTVSMNMWGFAPGMMDELGARFPRFLREMKNPVKDEYFLPGVANDLIAEGLARVRVLKTPERWYGVTYREDKPAIAAAFARMIDEGLYPKNMFA